MEIDLPKLLKTIYLKHPPNLFDEFIKECEGYYTKPAHSLTELKLRNNKKVRGDIFEEFCVLYLKHIKGYETVWLLEDVPADILVSLSMKRQDMGIDLVVSRPDGFYAVQCKYKKKEQRKTSVSWSALSTFYALCLRTGPWQKYIVMTTADYTRHQGPKTQKDISICIGSLRGIKTEDWLKMCQVDSHISEEVAITHKLTDEQIRAKRLSYFTTQTAPPQDAEVVP